MFHSETIKLWTEAHVPTPRYGRYLTHAHIQPEYQRPFTAEASAKHSFKWASVHNLVVSFRYWEGQSVREKIWERGCAGNQEKHCNKKNQNVYSAFQSQLCEVCLTDKLLSKTTSNKKRISAHRLEKRFCYFAKLCLIRMVIKLKWKTIVTLLQVKFETYSEENTKPGEVICKLAKDVDANLIVMGSRGMGTLRRTLLGSVSDYCVHHAHIPVAIVPPPNRHGGHARSS